MTCQMQKILVQTFQALLSVNQEASYLIFPSTFFPEWSPSSNSNNLSLWKPDNLQQIISASKQMQFRKSSKRIIALALESSLNRTKSKLK
jgi:hypothetical protein